MNDRELNEACGVIGCVIAEDCPKGAIDLANTISLGLVALQHRGQEGAGIVTSEGKGASSFNVEKGCGLVANVFTEEKLAKLSVGKLGLGHNRYSTAGGKDPTNIQPFVVHTRHGPLAVAHNGQLINASALRSSVLDRGIGLSTQSDSELITQVLSLSPPRGEKKGPDWPARIRHLMEATPTAYSLAMMFEDKIYGVRDPFGNRPLCIGKLMPLNCDDPNPKPQGWILSSESCAFQSVGAVFMKEVLPGEIVEISSKGVKSIDVVARPKQSVGSVEITEQGHSPTYNVEERPPAFCIFEYVYFARPDSVFEGQQVHQVRTKCGRALAKEAFVDADVVAPIPESALAAALGYSEEAGIPFSEVLYKNRYVGRSFIMPDERSRELAIAKKFGAITENIKGKRVILIDDSIVRGNTVAKLIKLIRHTGASEVHLRIASPPIKYPCYMGINIPTTEELIANKKAASELASHVGADSLVYLSIEGLKKAVSDGAKATGGVGHCTACLDNKYPTSLDW